MVSLVGIVAKPCAWQHHTDLLHDLNSVFMNVRPWIAFLNGDGRLSGNRDAVWNG